MNSEDALTEAYGFNPYTTTSRKNLQTLLTKAAQAKIDYLTRPDNALAGRLYEAMNRVESLFLECLARRNPDIDQHVRAEWASHKIASAALDILSEQRVEQRRSTAIAEETER